MMGLTTWNDQGFRRVACPMCGQTVRVTSLQDDTRWRYERHSLGSEAACAMSGELVAPDAGLGDEAKGGA